MTDSIPGRLTRMECLGFLPGSHCPHYDGEKERRPAYRQFVASGLLKRGVAADDGAALHFVDGKLMRVVSSRPHAKAYIVERTDNGVQETAVETTYLGGEDNE